MRIIDKMSFNMKILLFLFSIYLSFFVISCGRPGGEDEEGLSYTYGLQIKSITDYNDNTSNIYFDLSSTYLNLDEEANVNVSNVTANSGTGGSSTTPTPTSILGAALPAPYDETDAIHLTAYRVDYHLDGFSNPSQYYGRINVVVSAGGSATFRIILITGADKANELKNLHYTTVKGYITITLSGYDGDGKDVSRSINVDTFVFTVARITPTPTVTVATPTITATPTPTITATPLITITPTVTSTFFYIK
jgi:hypothetical protein